MATLESIKGVCSSVDYLSNFHPNDLFPLSFWLVL